MVSINPILDSSFDIKWSALTADLVKPAMQQAIKSGNKALDEIAEIPDSEETFENTFLALEEATLLVSQPWHKINHLTAVNDHPELRRAHLEILPEVSEFFSAISLNQQIYRKLKNFSNSPAQHDLEPIEERFVEETLKDFEDAGASLPEETRNRLKEIESQLAQKTKNFSDNVLDSTNAFELIIDSAEDLSGLPESFIEAARLNALKKGIGSEMEPKYRFSLQMPSFAPASRFIDSDDIRRQLYEGFMKVGLEGEFKNDGLIREILSLRKEKAQLLGKEMFPDWALSRRMAGSGKRALEFIEELQKKTKPAFDAEIKELETFKAEKTGQKTGPLNQWETSYWTEKLKKERFDFDEEELRPYFPMESVMHGMFQLVETIFGITVTELTDPKPDTWHPEVKVYKVTDSSTGRHMGSFYTDWFPREEKEGGAWMSKMITGKWENGSLGPHLGQVAGNLMPPVGDKPSLLSHRDVETIFHEFGHLIHHLLSDVKIRSLAGTNVAWDFVELPSQIMENWCWERESLDLFARHYETGERIPEDLFNRLKRTRTFAAGRFQMRQLSLGKMDLALHMDFDPDDENVDLDAFIKQTLEGYLPPVNIEFPSGVRGFGHLFSSSTGYAAGYYSYKWAEVLDADAFTRFQKEGFMNPETGMDFRRNILSKGNSEEPNVLFQRFMGRDPDPSALLRRLGLVEES